MLNFTSDNCAGAHPEVLDALVRANVGQEVSYGTDSYTWGVQRSVENFQPHPLDMYVLTAGLSLG